MGSESGKAGVVQGEFHLKIHKGDGCDLSPLLSAATIHEE